MISIFLLLLLISIIYPKLCSISEQLNNIDIDISRLELKLDDIHSELFPRNSYDSHLYKQLYKIREDMLERK